MPTYEACKEIEKYVPYTGKKMKAVETTCETDQLLNLWENDFKVVMINVFMELKKTMTKDVKEGIIITLHQMESTKRKIFFFNLRNSELH